MIQEVNKVRHFYYHFSCSKSVICLVPKNLFLRAGSWDLLGRMCLKHCNKTLIPETPTLPQEVDNKDRA
jgi:hypothetical protein